MTVGRGIGGDAAGGPARHVPVLLEEAMRFLAPDAGGVFIDGTFGGGGYTRRILAAGGSVIAIDRDPEAIARGAAIAASSGHRLTLVQGRFSDLDRIAQAHGHERVDGVVLDVGVSSYQLDTAERGFSFMQSGPLDMRMGDAGPTAGDVVNQIDERGLSRIIAVLGEEKRARSVAKAIVSARREAAIDNTHQLAEIVSRALGGRRGEAIHPATRTFQALRIFVNRELDELADALAASERILGVGGRLVVVAFHSLEDRIVKRFLSERSTARAARSRHEPEAEAVAPTFNLLLRSGVAASEAEAAANPRARSARLRAAVRTAAPARPADKKSLGVPDLDEITGAG